MRGPIQPLDYQTVLGKTYRALPHGATGRSHIEYRRGIIKLINTKLKLIYFSIQQVKQDLKLYLIVPRA